MNPIAPIYFLLVDDREENLIPLEALLRRDGLVILKARTGVEALELLLKYDVALALMDVQMPGMDGFELAELMRGNERTGSVPIIFITAGAADTQRRFRGYQAGAVDFIYKPIETDVLRSKAAVFFQLKQQKNQLARQRDELQATADENARLLEQSHRAQAALQQADQRKDDFLATLAHELRNPLATLSCGLEVFRLSPSSEEADSTRDLMERQLAHLVRLIDDLLDASRISRGKITLQRKRILLQDALGAAVETSRHLIESEGHRLELSIAREEIWIDADLVRLAQVVGNLLNNAAKYTPSGGRITLEASRSEGKAVVAVTDTGIGIPAEKLSDVFGLFVQADPASTQAQGGLGIGLSLARVLVELHGGSLEAASEGPGKGSRFTIKVPVAEKAPPPEERSAPQSAAEGEPIKRSILVVDDNLAAARTLSRVLSLKGHECEMAHSGGEGLDKARRSRPEIVLLDIGLPDMSGYDVCRELRLDPRFSDTLIIAQTGWGQKRDVELARDAGFDHHLVKPLAIEALTALIDLPRPADAPQP